MTIPNSAGRRAIYSESLRSAPSRMILALRMCRRATSSAHSPSWARIASTIWRVSHPDEIQGAVRSAIASGKPAVVELMVDSQELFDPFRRD